MCRYKWSDSDNMDPEEYFFIPKALFKDQPYKGLTLQEKLIYSYILNDGGKTKSTNRELGNFLGVTKDRIQQILATLADKGFIESVVFRNERKQVMFRIIRIKR